MGRNPGKTAVPVYEGGVLDEDRYWGWRSGQFPTFQERHPLFMGGATVIPPFFIWNLIPMPGGIHIATSSRASAKSVALKDGQWFPSPSYGPAIDIAADGVAIGNRHDGINAPIWINGRWTGIERTAPDATGWHVPGMSLLDTTPGGWILGWRTVGDNTDHFVMLPIRAKGTYAAEGEETRHHSAGVDSVSIGSTNPDATNAPELAGTEPVKDRIWIMAPIGGRTTTVTLRAPLHAQTPLKLSAPGIKFNGQDEITLNETETTLQISAGSGVASGTDVPAILKFGDLGSLSQPLGFKTMKERTVKVTVHPVSSIVPGKNNNAPNVVPDKALLEKTLNNIYHPQMNVKFDVTVKPMANLAWDTATAEDLGGGGAPRDSEWVYPGNGVLDWTGGGALSTEEQNIHNALKDDGAHINIYVLGGAQNMGLALHNGRFIRTQALGAYAHAKRQPRVIFVDGDSHVWDFLGRNFAHDQYGTFAHEIGHIIAGEGHPDQKSGPAFLPGLPESAYPDRLMVSGNKTRRPDHGILLVKGEWDAAELWLNVWTP